MTPAQIQAEWRDITAEHPMLADIPMCILWPFTEADVEKWPKLKEWYEKGGKRMLEVNRVYCGKAEEVMATCIGSTRRRKANHASR